MAELDRARDAELGKTTDVLRREALRVLDSLAQPQWRPHVVGRLERIQRRTVRRVADRVDGDGPAGRCARADDLRELLLARDDDAGAVEHPRGLGAERPVHERLQIADPEEVVADPRVDAEGFELGQPFVGNRLPDPERQTVERGDALEDTGSAKPAVLVVNGDDPAR